MALNYIDLTIGCQTCLQDNPEGGFVAATQLIHSGCERIAWFGHAIEQYHGRTRYGGAAAAMASVGRAFSHVVTVNITSRALEEYAMELLDSEELWGAAAWFIAVKPAAA